jgi:hypothetical protein
MTQDDVKKSINETVGKLSADVIHKRVEEVMGSGMIANVSADTLILRIKKRRDQLLALAKGLAPIKVEEGPKIAGKLYSDTSHIFTDEKQPLFPVEPEKQPKLPSGPQSRCMAESSKATGHNFTTDNWNDANHPRPDRDGIPTNMQSHEFNRLFDLGQKYMSAWKGSAQSKGASALKRAAIRVFNVNGCVWANNDVDTEQNRWNNDRVVRMIYNDTQNRMAARGVTDKDAILLFRGVKAGVVVAGAIEGHSYSKTAASNFDGHDIIKRWVHPAEVLADNRSAFFPGNSYVDEKEWLVFAGGFGSPMTHTGSAKNEQSAKASAAKIVSYATGKKPKLTPAVAKPEAAVPASTGQTSGLKAFSDLSDHDIIHIKTLLLTKTVPQVAKETGVIATAVRTIRNNDSKKAAETGPRFAAMKKHMEVTEAQWAAVKKDGAQQLINSGKHDYDALAKTHGISHWKVRAILFAKKKSELVQI